MNKRFYMHKISNLIIVQKIVTIHYQELHKNYEISEEAHNFWEIIYADKNEVICFVDGAKKIIKQGEILFLSPNQVHSVYGNKKVDTNIFVMSFDCKSTAMNYFINKQLHLSDELKDLLSVIINEAKNTFELPIFDPNLNKLILKDNSYIGGEQIIKNNLEQLLIYLLREESVKPTSDITFISKLDSSTKIDDLIKKYLKNNLYNKITLDNLCEEIHYGKTFLCTTFKKNTGSTIIHYFIKLRIEEAKKLIKQNQTFSEISEKLNFDSLSHFTNTFKKYTKMSPRQYKKSIFK